MFIDKLQSKWISHRQFLELDTGADRLGYTGETHARENTGGEDQGVES